MVALPKSAYSDPTTARVKVAIVEGQSTHPRTYMGMSGMGDVCERRIWLRFRWAYTEKFSAETLCNFEDGHRTEDLVIKRLRLAGFEVISHGEDGRQLAHVDFGGHYRGNMDGLIAGLPNAPVKQHVLEVKCTNEESYRKLLKLIETLGEKQALRAWKPEYYAQAQSYMHYQGTDRHYTVVATPGGRDFTGLRTEYDAVEALKVRARAERLIFSDKPPEKLMATHFICRMCSMHGMCHGKEPAQRNCRTCLHVTPMPDGTWHCAKWDKILDDQSGCDAHLYIPALVPGKVIDAGVDFVKYEIDGKEWVDGTYTT